MNEDLRQKLGLEINEAEKDISSEIEKVIPFNLDTTAENDTSSLPTNFIETKKEAKKIDINKINIVDASPIEKEKDLRNALFGNKSVFTIIAAQSGYMAQMAPLVHKDIINIMSSNLNRFERQKAIYKVVYDKIQSFSCGKLTFDEWLKLTSSGDIETFYYGIYCVTFPGLGEFTFECPNPDCEEQTTMKLDNANLIKTANNEKMKKLIAKVSKQALSKDEMKKYSLIGKYDAYQLDDSGIIMELRTPSLWDVLDMLQKVPEKLIDRDAQSAEYLLYINRLLIPTQDDPEKYSEQTDRQEIFRIIDNLSIDDAERLENSISEKYDENRISYSVKNIECPKCKAKFKDTEISIENILFTLIYEKAQ